MCNVQEMTRDQIVAEFERLFRQVVADCNPGTEWQQADICFRNGKASGNFADVEFLMASGHNGSSLLYSSGTRGSGIYSVLSDGARVSFTCRCP